MTVAFAHSRRRGLLAIFLMLIAVAIALGVYQGERFRAYLATEWKMPPTAVTLYNTDYWMGELVKSIVERGEYRGCYTSTVSAQPATVGLCFSAHRMPVVPLFMALIAKVNNSVVFFLTIRVALSMALLCVAAWLILEQAEDWRVLGAGLAAVYVATPPNLQIFLGTVTEESFFIPQMTLAGALLFARSRGRGAEITKRRLACLAILVALMPMTKSSALLPAAVIAMMLALKVRSNRLAPLLPLAALVFVLAAWGIFTYRGTGHFASANSLSSLNGYNLHHGYTPYYGEVAPRYHLDLPVSRGQIKLEAPVHDEWELNKQFNDRAMAFVREHPLQSLWYLVIKAYAATIKLTPEYRLQSGEDGFFLPKHLILTAGLILDRAVLWFSLIASFIVCWSTFRRAGWKALISDSEAFSATLLILVTLAFLVPFVIAFSTYRHIVPLYYFQVAYLATFVLRSPLLDETAWGKRLRRLVGRPVEA